MGQTQLCPISQSCVWNTSGLCHFDSQWHHERLLLKAIVPPAEPNVQNPCANHRWPFLQRHYKSRNKSIQILPKTNQNPPKKESIPPKPYRSTNTPKPTQTPTKTLPKIMSNTHPNPPKKLYYQNHTKNPPKPQQRLCNKTHHNPIKSRPRHTKANQNLNKYPPHPDRKPTKTQSNTIQKPTETRTHQNENQPPQIPQTHENPITQPQKHPRAKPRPLPANFVERMLMTTQGATFLFFSRERLSAGFFQ